MTRSRIIGAVAALAGAAAGCGSCGEDDRLELSRRARDGAAVVVVERTADGIRVEDEVEPNDASDQAMALALPGGARGTLAGSDDVDRYRLTVAEPGWLRARVDGVDGVDLILEVAPAGKAPIAHCDNGPALVAEGVPNVPVEPGEYEVIVREYVKKRGKQGGREGASPRYRMTAAVQAQLPERMEREPNAEPDTAARLVFGGEVEGYVGWRDDRDLWQIPLDDVGAGDGVDIDIDGVGNVEYTLRLVDAKGGVVLERKAGKGEGAAIRSWMPGDAPDAAYYLSVAGRRSSFDHPYRLRAAKREIAADEEAEPNDAPASATPLAAEPGAPAGVRRGQLTRGDTDVYAAPVAGAQRLRLSVDRAVTLSVVDAGGTVLVEPTTQVADVEALVPAGTRAFVTLARADGTEAAVAYTLKWSALGQ